MSVYERIYASAGQEELGSVRHTVDPGGVSHVYVERVDAGSDPWIVSLYHTQSGVNNGLSSSWVIPGPISGQAFHFQVSSLPVFRIGVKSERKEALVVDVETRTEVRGQWDPPAAGRPARPPVRPPARSRKVSKKEFARLVAEVEDLT